jgi:hypothetical protein
VLVDVVTPAGWPAAFGTAEEEGFRLIIQKITFHT